MWQGVLVLLGLYWFAYAVVWFLRYLYWRSELRQLREGLGLAPAKQSSVFQVKPIRSYLLRAAVHSAAIGLRCRESRGTLCLREPLTWSGLGLYM